MKTNKNSPRPFVNDYININRLNFKLHKNFVFINSNFMLTKGRGKSSKVKMIVAQQKFLLEIFAEHPKFWILIFAF